MGKFITDRLLFLFIAAAIIATAICYSRRIKAEDPIDKLKNTLVGVTEATPPEGNITLQLMGVANEIPYWVRYTLAPRYIAQVAYRNDTVTVEKEVNGQMRRMLRVVKAFKYDTALTIFPLRAPDSVVQQTIGNRRVMWQNRDDHYSYVLTSGH